MNYFLSTIIGFLLGSIPTAYLILKKSKGIDIRNEGSKNVGAMNSYEVTNSKLLGFLVLLIDFSKGVLSVVIPIFIFGDYFIYPAIAALFAVLAHCFNPWIGFKGGRGLATFAGSALIIFPYLLAVWILLWVIFYLIKKDILFSNIAATIFSMLLIFNTIEIAVKYTNPKPETISSLILFTIAGLVIIFIKHIEPFKEFIYNTKLSGMNKDEK
jgi:acyl phosphate:glycerol-3-phosphate acyltransferase